MWGRKEITMATSSILVKPHKHACMHTPHHTHARTHAHAHTHTHTHTLHRSTIPCQLMTTWLLCPHWCWTGEWTTAQESPQLHYCRWSARAGTPTLLTLQLQRREDITHNASHSNQRYRKYKNSTFVAISSEN